MEPLGNRFVQPHWRLGCNKRSLQLYQWYILDFAFGNVPAIRDQRHGGTGAGGGGVVCVGRIGDRLAALEGKVGLMKKIVICGLIGLVVGLLSPGIAAAQGTTVFLSNLEQASGGSSAAGSDSWLAAGFQTGDNASGYMLDAVQLEMADVSGAANGFTVMIYANRNNAGLTPGTSLGDLGGSASPTSAGAYTYTPSSSITLLLPSSVYFIVMTANTKIATGAYEWSYAAADNYNPAGGWGSLGGGWTSSNGASWNASSAVFSQFAINATPTPEPGVVGLMVVGGLIVADWRRRHGA